MRAPSKCLADERLGDVTKCAAVWAKAGLHGNTIRIYRQRLSALLVRTRIWDYSELTPQFLEGFARSFARRYGQRLAAVRKNLVITVRAFAWALPQIGRVGPPFERWRRPGPPLVTDRVIAAFLDDQRRSGLADSTVVVRRHWVNLLLAFQRRHQGRWPVSNLREIDSFLEFYAKRRAASSIGQAACAIRCWLRFLFTSGRSKCDLSSAVLAPVQSPFRKPARTAPWPVIRRLARGIDCSTAVGCRDYAIYLLACAYGMSAGDVLHLKLDDIDWRERAIHFRRRKTGSAINLPLLSAVADALSFYVNRARPPTTSAQIFVSHQIPYAPLQNGSYLSCLIRRWSRRAGIRDAHVSAHMIRHAHATRQLEAGTTLKVIGDILGHQDPSTTSMYLRTALKHLRQMALPVPK